MATLSLIYLLFLNFQVPVNWKIQILLLSGKIYMMILEENKYLLSKMWLWKADLGYSVLGEFRECLPSSSSGISIRGSLIVDIYKYGMDICVL